MSRPPFIISSSDVPEKVHRYPNSEEDLSASRPIGRAAGLLMLGIHLVRVPPGRRTSYPHAEAGEEEFVYVIEGEIDAWIDGELHRMKAGDFAAFPSKTGICHTFLNNGERDAEQDASGFFIVHPGERVDFDSTQKNAGGEICQWVTDPEWTINGGACPMEANCGVIFRRGSSQPFLLKTTIQQLGTFTVQASIDGVVSNVLDMRSTPN